MSRFWWLVPAVLACTAVTAFAQHDHGKPGTTTMTDAQKIASAMSAAPAAIAAHAAIMDWPEAAGKAPRQLRAGTNGWVCYPNSPAQSSHTAFEDPMCLDKAWQSWGEAWQSHSTPKVSGLGIAYMLKGDKGTSNVDPFATAPTADNQWVRTGPHVMVLLADPALLDTFSTDPEQGGPYVMWKGTPYAHLMVPVGAGTKMMMTMKETPSAAKPATHPPSTPH